MKRMLWVLVAVFIAIASTACGGGGGSGGEALADEDTEPVPGGKVVLATEGGIDGFNPASSRLNPNGINVAKAIYDPLAVIDPDGQAVPYLAEAFEPNEDFTEWTITMRDGIKFHNGDDLTPQIVATHLKTMQTAPLTFFSMEPVDAVAVMDESARPRYEAGEISEDEYDLLRRQVVVLMREPWSTFPAFLAAYQIGYVAHPDYTSGAIEDPVGTGPFRLEEWIPGDQVTVVRNNDYWRDGLPYLDEIVFREMPDSESRIQSLRAGDIDMMTTSSPDQLHELTEDPGDLELHPSDGAGEEQVVVLNTQTGVTADLEVRRMLQLATDRAAINNQLYDGFFELADAPFTEDSVWYTDPGWPEPDADAVKTDVEAWEADHGPIEISLAVVASQANLQLAQAVAAQWDAAGITTEIEAVDSALLAQIMPLGEFEAVMVPFFPGADPDEHYVFMDPNEENIGGPGELSINFARFTSDAVKDAMIGARQTDDESERVELYGQLWREFAKQAPYLWLFHTNYLLLSNPDVRGLDEMTLPNGDPVPVHVQGSIFLTEAWRAP